MARRSAGRPVFSNDFYAVSLRELRIFQRLAREEISIESLAKDLEMNSRSVTRSLERIQDKVGMPLFETGRFHGRLSATGARLLRFADQVLPSAARFEQEQGGAWTTIVIGYRMPSWHSGAIGDYGVMDWLKDLREQAPYARYEMLGLSETELNAQLREGSLDLAITNEDEEFADYRRVLLSREMLLLFYQEQRREQGADEHRPYAGPEMRRASPGNGRLAFKTLVNDESYRQKYVAISRGRSVQLQVEEAFQKLEDLDGEPLRAPPAMVSFNSGAHARDFINETDTVGWLPEKLVKRKLESGTSDGDRLREVKGAPPAYRDVHLLYRRHLPALRGQRYRSGLTKKDRRLLGSTPGELQALDNKDVAALRDKLLSLAVELMLENGKQRACRARA